MEAFDALSSDCAAELARSLMEARDYHMTGSQPDFVVFAARRLWQIVTINIATGHRLGNYKGLVPAQDWVRVVRHVNKMTSDHAQV